jgi:hypothetical protein
MSRKLLVVVIAVGAALVITIPAVASFSRPGHSTHLVLSVKHGKGFGKAKRTAVKRSKARRHSLVMSRTMRGRTASIAAATETGTEVNQGFSCTAVAGTGPTDSTSTVLHTNDSSEFVIAYGAGLKSVTTNCTGIIPSGTTISSSIVSHAVTSCSQLNPSSPSGPSVAGQGVTTTYPDRMFSETCNTPNFTG